MISLTVDAGTALSARYLPRIFSNYTRCTSCRSSAIRVHYCPGCPQVSGSHFHRFCGCGAIWLERSAAHAPIDISLDNPVFVAICQHCRTRMDRIRVMQPKCCRMPEVGYHDTREPCELCCAERVPGEEDCLRRLVLSLILGVVIGVLGCGPRYQWVKPDASAADIQRDQYECERDMRMSAASFGAGFAAQSNADAFMERCFAARGYVKISVASTEPVPGAAPSQGECRAACESLQAGPVCLENCARYENRPPIPGAAEPVRTPGTIRDECRAACESLKAGQACLDNCARYEKQ